MELDPEIAAYLSLVGNGRDNGKNLPMHQLDPQQARAQFEQSSRLMDPAGDALARQEMLGIPARDGTILAARLYSPQPRSHQQALPTLLYLHGGGYVVGSLDSHHALCAGLAEAAGCIVIALAYRLAPSWRFPTAVEDVEDAWHWLAEHVGTLGGDSALLAVAGDSAGGTLCAALCQRLALDAARCQPRLQALIYPVTDASREAPSIGQYGSGFLLEKDTLSWFYEHYQRTPADRLDPRFSPLLGEVPQGLAPSLIIVAQCDPLHDEGVAYAQHLQAAGAQVSLRVFAGMTHDFLRMGALVDQADEARELIAAALAEAWARVAVPAG